MQKLFTNILSALLALVFSTAAAIEGGSTSFEEALQETGWSVYRTFSGDLVLTTPAEKRAIPIASQDIDLETLANKLEAAGWKVQRKSDGSLDLHPRETAETEIATSREESQASLPADEQWAQMQQQLKAAGWDASRDADGSLVLIPPGDTADETTIRKEAPAPSQADERWEQMQQQLNAAGWQASRDADGSLILIPPAESVETAAAEEKAAAPQDDSMETMQQKLKATGWQVTENSDGSILLYPPEQQRSEGKTIQPCSGHAPSDDDVDLPVNTWSQARNLAKSWLKRQTPDNLKVGKIREIFEVYLVSILTGTKPYRLRHQIAIRRSDGHIIVLN
ncbi:MAG: hypothetical protein ABFR19_08725 [Pseudomonadota bacterium]